MSETTDTKTELEILKERADLLSIKYHPNIGVEALRQKVNAALADQDDAADLEQTNAAETVNSRRLRLRQEASKLIRIRVTCMNPAKKDHQGDIFSVGNGEIGTFRKYVPFNSDNDGWHVPYVIYQHLKERECPIFVNVKNPQGGGTSQKAKMIKEFAIEVLDPLTPEELKDLAQRQAMAHSID